MTYDELTALCMQGDVLVDPARPDRVSQTEEGLIILGQSGPEEYASDMRIVIEPNGLRAWMRDPEGTSEEDKFHGPDWTEEAFFETYDALVSWAYSW